MKRFSYCLVLSVLILFLGSQDGLANMKKAKVGGGGTKGFVFSTLSDGFCTISTIYDKTPSQLAVAMGLGTTGDLVCAGFSTQTNFQSCSAGLPAGTYIFVVTSLRGPSPFRVVVNCSDQQNLVAAGALSRGGVEIREIELGTAGNRLLEQLNDLATEAGRAR